MLPAFGWIIEIGKCVSLSTGREILFRSGERLTGKLCSRKETACDITSWPFLLQVWRAHVLPPNNFYSRRRSRPLPGRVAMVSRGARSGGPGFGVMDLGTRFRKSLLAAVLAGCCGLVYPRPCRLIHIYSSRCVGIEFLSLLAEWTHQLGKAIVCSTELRIGNGLSWSLQIPGFLCGCISVHLE